jgi:hypothetical protein
MRSFSGVAGVLLVGLFASTSASASNESLTFRRTATGSIEAVVSGTTTGCDVFFYPSNAVTVEGGTVTITSLEASGDCPLPHTLTPYEVTADLGILAAQSYQVVWNQPFVAGNVVQVSAVLVPAAVVGGVAISAPTLSWWGLTVLTLMLGAFAGRHRNFIRSKI